VHDVHTIDKVTDDLTEIIDPKRLRGQPATSMNAEKFVVPSIWYKPTTSPEFSRRSLGCSNLPEADY